MSNTTISKEAVVIERIFDAPVDLIWQMWTNPEHFKNWYGPKGFTVPIAEMDVRVVAQVGIDTGYVFGDYPKPEHLKFTLQKERTKWHVIKTDGLPFEW